jgi:hypothetical protein
MHSDGRSNLMHRPDVPARIRDEDQARFPVPIERDIARRRSTKSREALHNARHQADEYLMQPAFPRKIPRIMDAQVCRRICSQWFVGLIALLSLAMELVACQDVIPCVETATCTPVDHGQDGASDAPPDRRRRLRSGVRYFAPGREDFAGRGTRKSGSRRRGAIDRRRVGRFYPCGCLRTTGCIGTAGRLGSKRCSERATGPSHRR